MSLGFFGPKPPFQLDQTQSGKASTATIAATEYADVAGQIYLFSSLPRTHGGPVTSLRPSLGLAVRNASGSAFTPAWTGLTAGVTNGPTYAGKSVAMKADGTLEQYASCFSGASSTTVGGKNYPMSHLAPAMAANDIAWAICGGPAWASTDSAGDTNFAAGAFLIPGGGTAGKLVEQTDPTAAGTVINVILAAIGRAMTAVNGTSTSVPVLVSGI